MDNEASKGMIDQMADLMQPVPGEHPAGEDMSYSLVFDQIREARRQDDPSLSMGDWEVSLKVADWPRVARLCEETLRHQTKDLQVLVWYAEALVHTRGFTGAAASLHAIAAWLRDYWLDGFPVFDAHDLDERIGKLEWLNQHLALALKQVAMVAPAAGGYHWLDWHQSREVDNLALRNADAWQAALNEGKLSGEQFDKAAQESGRSWFESLASSLSSLEAAYVHCDEQLLLRFGPQAPSMVELRDVIHACRDLANRYRQRWQAVEAAIPAPASPATAGTQTGAQAMAAQPAGEAAGVSFDGQIRQRQDAVRMLREVARYFRHNEPHSPVALLAERAARWADMSLEEWLQHVVKDDGTLQQLRELLDVRTG